MKAEMFVVTAIFMVMFIFVVNQILFTYSKLDLSTPFQTTDYYGIKNIIDVINQTVIATSDCSQAKENLEELFNLLKKGTMEKGYYLDLNHNFNCSNWNNPPPQANPLNVSLSVIGRVASTGSYYFYHTYG